MLHFLPVPILATIAAFLVILNTLFWGIPLTILALAKLLVFTPAQQATRIRWLTGVMSLWTYVNKFCMWLLLKTKLEVKGLEGLNLHNSYLIISNHQTWLDIPVILQAFDRKIPFPRFFLKQQLIWVPVVGQVCWGMDMPFMKRYSKEFLKKHPEMQGKDLEITRKACEKYKNIPVSILSFLEGSRFSPKKHAQQESPYRHLLQPRAGGVAFALSAMGDQFEVMLDVTITYPDSQVSLWEYFSGRVPRIIMQVEQIAIPPEFLEGDYLKDPDFREQLQVWIRDRWSKKDKTIEQTSLYKERVSE